MPAYALIQATRDAVETAPPLLAAVLALGAGAASFFSPCVLPVLPGYLAYISGIKASELLDPARGATQRSRVVAGASLFVAGFSLVFVILGTASGALGSTLLEYRRSLSVVLGALCVLLGLALVGKFGALQRPWRPPWPEKTGLAVAPVIGFLFGLAWTPCMTPVLGVIINLSLLGGDASRGALLCGFYALGLALPFLGTAIATARLTSVLGALRGLSRAFAGLSSATMILLGLLLITGRWDQISTALQVAVLG